MRHTMLLVYQWVTGLSDTAAGGLLYVAPATTLRLVGVHAPDDASPYVAYIGAFVLSVGVACLYGAHLVLRRAPADRIEMIWLLTAFSRSAVAIYVLKGMFAGDLEAAWLPIVIFDGVCVVIQCIGLRKRWLADAY